MSCLKKIIQHHKFINPIKNSVNISTLPHHKNIVPLTRNRPVISAQTETILWAKYDVDNFDGFYITGFLSYKNEIVSSGNFNFNVYLISTDNNWTETLIVSKSNVKLSDGKNVAHIDLIDLGSIQLDGDFTIAIECEIPRQNQKFYKKIYVNHLGIYENVFRLRQDVEFLDITKVDE